MTNTNIPRFEINLVRCLSHYELNETICELTGYSLLSQQTGEAKSSFCCSHPTQLEYDIYVSFTGLYHH